MHTLSSGVHIIGVIYCVYLCLTVCNCTNTSMWMCFHVLLSLYVFVALFVLWSFCDCVCGFAGLSLPFRGNGWGGTGDTQC